MYKEFEFKELPIGEVFELENECFKYIKMPCIETKQNDAINAVNATLGTYTYFSEHDSVYVFKIRTEDSILC